jgi:hypothetical protein
MFFLVVSSVFASLSPQTLSRYNFNHNTRPISDLYILYNFVKSRKYFCLLLMNYYSLYFSKQRGFSCINQLFATSSVCLSIPGHNQLNITPLRRTTRCRYSSALLNLCARWEQLHVHAVLPPGKQPRYTLYRRRIGLRAGLDVVEKRTCFHYENRSPIPVPSSP